MQSTGTSITDLLNTGKACFIAILLFSLLQLCPFRLMWQIGGDDLSYLSHAFTIALDFDLEYANEPATRRSGNGMVASHPMGPGVMAAPFVAAFSVIDRLTANPVIGNHALYSGSWSYFGFLAASVFYYLSGIYLYYRSMLRVRDIGRTTAFLLLASSGAAYFAMNRFTLGHSFEFFLLAVVFWGTVLIWELGTGNDGGDLSRELLLPSITVAAAIIFTLFVRPANVNVLLLPALLLAVLMAAGEGVDWRIFRHSLWRIYFWTLLLALPFAVFNHAVYGVLYPTMSALYKKSAALSRYGIDPDHSGRTAAALTTQVLASIRYLPNLLFGSEHGVLYSNPLSLIGIVMLLSGLAKSSALRLWPRVALLLLVLGYCALPVSVVLLWKTTAGSYGYRYLFSIFPVAVIGYLFWLKTRPVLDRNSLCLHRALIALCLFSVLSSTFFGMTQRLEVREGINAFGVNYKASANGYDLTLIEELGNPRAWFLMLAKKTPGFLGFNLAQYAGLDPEAVAALGGIGNDYKRVVNKMKEFQHGSLVFSPGGYLLQLSVLLLFLCGFAVLYCRVRPSPERQRESNPSGALGGDEADRRPEADGDQVQREGCEEFQQAR